MSKFSKINVMCYSGYKVNERPVSFIIGDKSLKVKQLIDQWCGEDYRYFKLSADDGNIYILRYEELKDEWEITFFKTCNR